jgi:transcription elongation factor GreA
LAIEKVFPMTQAGKDKLIQELEHLKSVKRKEVVERIKIARSFGDLSSICRRSYYNVREYDS